LAALGLLLLPSGFSTQPHAKRIAMWLESELFIASPQAVPKFGKKFLESLAA
jgi:hypothetical protein